MGKTFREAFDLQQSTQRNYYLTKVQTESVFRVLVLCHFYNLSSISAQSLAPGLKHSGAGRWLRDLLSPELWCPQSPVKAQNRLGLAETLLAWRPGFEPISSHHQSEDKKPGLLPFQRTSCLTGKKKNNRQNQEPYCQ